MSKNRLATLVFCVLLPLSAYAQTDNRGNFFVSVSFYSGLFGDESREIQPAFLLHQLNAIQLGVAWESRLGPGNVRLGLEGGFASGSRFGGRGYVDYFPVTFNTSYVLPLGNVLFIGPTLKFGVFAKTGPEWNRFTPLGRARLEAELRSVYFPVGLFVAGGADIFLPRSHDPSILPAVEVGLRFPRGRLRRREPRVIEPAPVVVEARPPVIRPDYHPAEIIRPPSEVPEPDAYRIDFEDGWHGIMHFICFEHDNLILTAESLSILNSVGRTLVANPELRVHIRSFPAAFDTGENRFQIGMNRARIIRDHFVRDFGITPLRMTVETFGSEIRPELGIIYWDTHRCADVILSRIE